MQHFTRCSKYESNPNTNAYPDSDKAKVDNLSGTNTGDETPASVKTKLLQNPDTNNFGDAEVLKLNGALQDIAEGTNVTIDKTNPNIPVINVSVPDSTVIVNNLTSDSTTSALSAAQGKALKGLIDRQFNLGTKDVSPTITNEEDKLEVTIAYQGYKQDFYRVYLDYLNPSLPHEFIMDNKGYNLPWSGVVNLSDGFNPEGFTYTIRLPSGQDADNKYIEIEVEQGYATYIKFWRYYDSTFWEFVGDRHTIAGWGADTTQIGNEIVTSRNLAVSDASSRKVTSVNSLNDVVLTIPSVTVETWPVGATINIKRKGTGTVEIVEGPGVTIESIRNVDGDIKISDQYGIITMYREVGNLWTCFGALETT